MFVSPVTIRYCGARTIDLGYWKHLQLTEWANKSESNINISNNYNPFRPEHHSAGEPGSRGYGLAPHDSHLKRSVPVWNGQLHSARFARSVPLTVSDGNWPFQMGIMRSEDISPGNPVPQPNGVPGETEHDMSSLSDRIFPRNPLPRVFPNSGSRMAICAKRLANNLQDFLDDL